MTKVTKRRSGRRGNQEGSITQLADGRWQARVTIEGSKRKSFYAKTRQEAQHKLTSALRDRDRGLPIVAEQQTVAQFLADWLQTIKPTIKLRTWTRYAEYVNIHTIPTLGRVRIAKLSAQQVQALYAAKLEAGLSPTTVNHLHATVHRALKQAMRWGVVPRNVADLEFIRKPLTRRDSDHTAGSRGGRTPDG